MLKNHRFTHIKNLENTAKTPWRTQNNALKLKYKDIHVVQYPNNNTDTVNINKGGYP